MEFPRLSNKDWSSWSSCEPFCKGMQNQTRSITLQASRAQLGFSSCLVVGWVPERRSSSRVCGFADDHTCLVFGVVRPRLDLPTSAGSRARASVELAIRVLFCSGS